jgi:hypothetical protein
MGVDQSWTVQTNRATSILAAKSDEIVGISQKDMRTESVSYGGVLTGVEYQAVRCLAQQAREKRVE